MQRRWGLLAKPPGSASRVRTEPVPAPVVESALRMSLAYKQELHAELLSAIATELAAAERAYRATREGATHEEAKPENDKDTRALEQTYLARGQAKRIEELRAGLAMLEGMRVAVLADDAAVAVGAVVELSEEGGDTTVFVAPCGGGSKLASGTVQVVTPQSPLGRALLRKRQGDECQVAVGSKTRQMVIVRVL